MESLPTRPGPLQVPNVDMSVDPRLYAVITSDWEYISPSNHLYRLVRNTLTSDVTLIWDSPRACRYACSYDVVYHPPVLSCIDYHLESIDPGLASNTAYRANSNVSNSYLTLSVTFWPMVIGTRTGGNSSSFPLGTRCTFHMGTYNVAMSYWGRRQNATILNYTRASDDILPGTSLGFSNSISGPRNPSWVISDPSSVSPGARVLMNTCAFVGAFSSSLSGAIATYDQSNALGPEERAVNSARIDAKFRLPLLYA